jgi:ATP-dependent Clp protease ATP-binding subunit ClpA
MISKDLQKVFGLAVNYARANHHEYITVEHIFIYLLKEDSIDSLLKELGIDTVVIYDKLKEYILKNVPKYPKEFQNDDPVESVTLTSTIEQMIAHTQLSGKKEANVEDMFVYILKDENAYCNYLLKTQGLERVDILEEISHGEIDDIEDLDQSTEGLNIED